MSESESDDNRSGFVWLLAGLGLGVAVGVLCAPRSGAETRKALRSNAEKGRDRLLDHAKRVRGHASDWTDRGRSFLDRWKRPAKEDLPSKAISAVEDASGKAVRATAGTVSQVSDMARKAV